MASSKQIVFFFCLFVGSYSQEFKCPKQSGYYPDPIQCDLYYDCVDGIPEEKLCPDGLVFEDSDPKYERCDIPTNVECGERTELQEPKPTPGCPRANGFFRHPDPEACDKFYNCVEGVPRELPCPPGLVYDDTRSTCSWQADSGRKDCIKSRKEVLDDGFSCPDGEVLGPDGRALPHPTFAHAEDCKLFYICKNGVQPQKGACDYGEVYNEDTMKCDDPANVPGCEEYYKDKTKPLAINK
ncbi:protein obstructor-E [Agrilus planipennis]|uniref:Protein obstructor-E n=1 Tax=Agrilus planipennis TaxID=224129 RepID=A0A1W4XCC5_AGRPL|nr:protein obstructor-E [Agrilus planipennis]